MTKTEVVYIEENLEIAREILDTLGQPIPIVDQLPDLQLTNTLLTEINEYLLLHPV